MSKRNHKHEEQTQTEANNNAETAKVYRMREHLSKYKPRYVTITSASGNSSLCNGDELAQRLANKTPEDVVNLASRLLGIDLAAKYDRLNPGQRRMNCGNRLRAALKKGTLTIDQIV